MDEFAKRSRAIVRSDLVALELHWRTDRSAGNQGKCRHYYLSNCRRTKRRLGEVRGVVDLHYDVQRARDDGTMLVRRKLRPDGSTDVLALHVEP